MPRFVVYRRARGTSALAGLVLAGAIAGCGLDPMGTAITPERQAEFQAIADKASRFSTLEQQAYVSNTLLQFAAAEQEYRETLSLARDLFPTDPARASYLRLHLALNKSNLGQYETAEDLFERSRRIVEELGVLSERAKPDLFYAQHKMNLKQYEDAERIARRAERTLSATIPAVSENARTDNDGVPLVRRADGALLLDQAQANILNARVTRGDAVVSGSSRTAAASAGADGRRDMAVDGSLLRLGDRQRLLLQRAHARYIIARALRVQGDSEAEVAQLIAGAEDDLAQVPDVFGRWLRAEFASLRADRLHEQGRHVEAVAELSSAIDLLRRYELDSRPEALLLLKKGEYLISAGRGREGAADYQRALEILRDDEQGIEVEQARSMIDKLLEDVQAGNTEAQQQLFLLMQRVRSSATAQTVAQLSARLSSGDDSRARAIRELQDLEREQNVLAARFDRLEGDPDADLHYKRVTEAKLNELRGSIRARRGEIAEIAPNYDRLIDAAIPLREAQAMLGDGEVMAIVQLGAETGLVAILTNVSFDAYEIPLNVTSAEEAVQTIRAPMDGDVLTAFDLEASSDLYETLFGPVKSRIDSAEHLIVVPTGPLLSLPFNALVTEPYEEEIELVGTDPFTAYLDYSKVDWLGAQTGISTGVSIASFFLGRKAPASAAPERFRGFGDFEHFGEDAAVVPRIIEQRGLPASCRGSVLALGLLNELPGTGEELRQVQEVLGVSDENIVVGRDFTDAAVKDMDLSRFRVLHFATHGLLAQDPQCLPEPGLVTSISPTGDGLLEASEIVGLDLDAQLVVMSACDTGAGAGQAVEEEIGFRGVGGSYAAGGESLNGLARSFFFAGARNVMSTHWSVEDRATLVLMGNFYTESGGSDDVTIAEALRASEAAMIDGAEMSHPFYWAPFAIIGDGASQLDMGGGGTVSAPASGGPAASAAPAAGALSGA